MKPHHRSRMPARAQSGVAMIEAMVATVILAIGLIGTLGLQARSQAALIDAGMRAEATIAANELIGMMNADIGNLTSFAMTAGGTPPARVRAWYAALNQRLPNATVSVTAAPIVEASDTTSEDFGRGSVAIEIRWSRGEGGEQHNYRITTYMARST